MIYPVILPPGKWSITVSVRLLFNALLKRCRTVLADKDYDSQALGQYCSRFRIKPIIPYVRCIVVPGQACPDCLADPPISSAMLSSGFFSRSITG